jgi:homoserine kinase type II
MSSDLIRSEIAEILEVYFPGSSFTFSKIESGSSNTTYRINQDEQTYVLSLFESNSSDHVDELTLILKQLEYYDISSSRVVATADRQLHTLFNSKPVLLKDYIEGEELTPAAVTESIVSDIGRELARLHLAGSFDSRRETQHYRLEVFESIASGLPEGEFSDWYLVELDRISNEFPSDLPMGFVHSDVFPNNIIIEGGKFKCLLDFEYLSYFPLVFDLSCGIVGLAWQNDRLNTKLSRSLIQGYEMVRRLEEAERKRLNYFCQYIALFFAGWRYRQFNIAFPNPERALDYKIMIEILTAFKNETLCLED